MHKSRICVVIIILMAISAALTCPLFSECNELDAEYQMYEVDRNLLYDKLTSMTPGDEAGVYAKMDGEQALYIVEQAISASEIIVDFFDTADIDSVSAQVYAKIIMEEGNDLRMESKGVFSCRLTVHTESNEQLLDLSAAYDVSGHMQFTDGMVPELIEVGGFCDLIITAPIYQGSNPAVLMTESIYIEGSETVSFPVGLTDEEFVSALNGESSIPLIIDSFFVLYLDEHLADGSLSVESYGQATETGRNIQFSGQIIDSLEDSTLFTAKLFEVLSQEGSLFTFEKVQSVSAALNHELTSEEYESLKTISRNIVNYAKTNGMTGFYYNYGEKTVHSTERANVEAIKSSTGAIIAEDYRDSIEYAVDKDVEQTVSFNYYDSNGSISSSIRMNVLGSEVIIPSSVVGHTVFSIDYIEVYAGNITLVIPSTVQSVQLSGWNFYGPDGVNVLSSNEIPGHKYVGTKAKMVQQPDVKHTVMYYLNGGSGSVPSQSVGEGSVYYLPSYSGTKTGYLFNGWSNGGVTYQPGKQFTMGGSDITYTAEWVKSEYTVAYNMNGGSGSLDSVIVQVGSTIQLPSNNGTNPGYTFAGWKYSGKTYSPGDSFTMPTQDVTFTAVWNMNAVHKVTYDLDDGIGTAEELSVPEGKTYKITTMVPTKDGYSFGGWVYNGTVYKSGETVAMGQSDMEFKAKWTTDINIMASLQDFVDGIESSTVLYIIIAEVAIIAILCVVYVIMRPPIR